MPTTTPVKGLPVPVGTDNPNIPADMLALATALERTVMVDFQAAPPGSPKKGDIHWDTDDTSMGSAGTPYIYNGSLWLKFSGATDGAAATPSLRTLGTGSTQAAAGNDARLSDQRVPTDNSVATAKLQNNAVTAGKIEAQQAWQTVAMTGAGFTGTVRYMKDSLGFVHIRPDVFSTSGVGSGTAFVLPAGYRPGVPSYFPVFRTDLQSQFPATYIVGTAGDVTTNGAFGTGAQVFTFSSIYFRAEN